MPVITLFILPILNPWKIKPASAKGHIEVSGETDGVRTAAPTNVSFSSLFSLHLGGNSKSLFPCLALLFQILSFS